MKAEHGAGPCTLHLPQREGFLARVRGARIFTKGHWGVALDTEAALSGEPLACCCVF